MRQNRLINSKIESPRRTRNNDQNFGCCTSSHCGEVFCFYKISLLFILRESDFSFFLKLFVFLQRIIINDGVYSLITYFMKCSFSSKLSSFFFQNTSFKQTVLKNSFWLLFSEFFAKVFTFLLGIWISQKFGDS